MLISEYKINRIEVEKGPEYTPWWEQWVHGPISHQI